MELSQSMTPSGLKPRDDAYIQKMNEYYAKRNALLDADKYLEPDWVALTDEMQNFRNGYEKPKFYSAREYMLDRDPDEFQVQDIRDDIDFQGLWDAMKNGKDFYEVASVNGEGFDSAVREKLFDGMANALGLEYDDVYYQWLGKPRPKKDTGPFKVDNGSPKPNPNYTSKFKAKYPDRYEALKKHPKSSNFTDEEIDEIAASFGLEL